MTLNTVVMLAYLFGADVKPVEIAKDFKSMSHCEGSIEYYRNKLKIPSTTTIGCQLKEASI